MVKLMTWEQDKDVVQTSDREVWLATAADGMRWAITRTSKGYALSADGNPVDSGRSDTNSRFRTWSDAARAAEDMNEVRS